MGAFFLVLKIFHINNENINKSNKEATMQEKYTALQSIYNEDGTIDEGKAKELVERFMPIVVEVEPNLVKYDGGEKLVLAIIYLLAEQAELGKLKDDEFSLKSVLKCLGEDILGDLKLPNVSALDVLIIGNEKLLLSKGLKSNATKYYNEWLES